MIGQENVLIYRLGSLGDTVVALPCFHAVRRAFPKARITLLTNRPVAAKAAPIEAILGNDFFFDEVLDYPVGARDPRALLALAKQIRRRRIGIVVFLLAARGRLSTLRDCCFFRFAGVRRIIGCPAAKSDFQPARNPATGLYEWESLRLARRLKKLGPIDLESDQCWDLRLTEEERSQAAALLEGSARPMLAVSLGTKVQAKDWGEGNWSELLGVLSGRLKDWRLVMLGAADERERSNACGESWAGPVLNLCGQTSPRVSAAILSATRLFIGHDSGPMHLAACVGTPSVAIFAARNLPGQWYPRGMANRILYHQTDCFGCGLDVCIVEKKKCILGISVHEVAEAVEVVLSAPIS